MGRYYFGTLCTRRRPPRRSRRTRRPRGGTAPRGGRAVVGPAGFSERWSSSACRPRALPPLDVQGISGVLPKLIKGKRQLRRLSAIRTFPAKILPMPRQGKGISRVSAQVDEGERHLRCREGIYNRLRSPPPPLRPRKSALNRGGGLLRGRKFQKSRTLYFRAACMGGGVTPKSGAPLGPPPPSAPKICA